MITDSDCSSTFGDNYSLSRYKALPWTYGTPPDANIVQTQGGAVTFVGSVQTDCTYKDQSNYLMQRKVGQEQKNKFEIYLDNPDARTCTDTNAVCRFCPLDCNGGVCKFDANDEPFCDCSAAVDVAYDCYRYTSDADVGGFRPINLPHTGALCEIPPAGLPAGFVTDMRVGDHGQCLSTHKDYTNGQNGGCAPGLFHAGCYGAPSTAHVCVAKNPKYNPSYPESQNNLPYMTPDCGTW